MSGLKNSQHALSSYLTISCSQLLFLFLLQNSNDEKLQKYNNDDNGQPY